MDFFEVLVGDVGVDLRGGDICVAKHSLNGAKVGAINQQISRKRVSHRVGRDFFGDAG